MFIETLARTSRHTRAAADSKAKPGTVMAKAVEWTATPAKVRSQGKRKAKSPAKEAL